MSPTEMIKQAGQAITEINKPTLEEIDENFTNGNKKEACRLIQEYGLYDFWADYYEYLFTGWNRSLDNMTRFDIFSEMVITYHRITLIQE